MLYRHALVWLCLGLFGLGVLSGCTPPAGGDVPANTSGETSASEHP